MEERKRKKKEYHPNKTDNWGSTNVEHYSTSFEHIQDELRRIDILIHNRIVDLKKEWQDNTFKDYRGFFIPDEEIKDIVKQAQTKDGKKEPTIHDTGISQNCIGEFQSKIAARVKKSMEKGIYLSLCHLGCLFQLTPFEVDCILLCLAVELDLKYGRLYAYMHNNEFKKMPSVDLVLQLLCSSPEQRNRAMDFFTDASCLFRYNLLTFVRNEHDPQDSFLSRGLKLDDHITRFLLESKGIDKRLTPFAKLLSPQVSLNNIIIPDKLRDRIKGLLNKLKDDFKNSPLYPLLPSCFYFHGPPGNGQEETAGAMCRDLGLSFFVVDLDMMQKTEIPFSSGIQIVLREALLAGAGIFFKNTETMFSDDEKSSIKRKLFEKEIEGYPGIIVIERGKTPVPGNSTLHVSSFIFYYDIPHHSLRQQLWKKYLGKESGENIPSVSGVADKFKLTRDQIKNAVTLAKKSALINNPGKPEITEQDLYKSCKIISNHKLAALSQKIEPKYRWEDIVLPKEKLTQLKEISNYVRYKHTVYEDWGFGRKLSLGKGLNALFFGVSGTGKTMAAEIIAGDLGLDLYKIDLSTVVSKYIGETEKNLDKIFKEAETSNSILFFDEADAIFGKRSEVKDAHDRYANIEVSYLLQKMEEYQGVVILATNFRKNMDHAFVRRMHFTVEFPFPNEQNRLKIWRILFPDTAPTDKDIDYEFLAKKFKITGGNIKNITVCSAFLAAGDSKIITMKHIMLAVKREFSKTGKLITPGDFGTYYHLTVE